MPLYLYRNPETQKIVEIVQKMNDIHEFVDENGIRYERIFLSPQTIIDTRVDPFSKRDWMKKTNKKCTIGEMMDESSQLSEKRATIAGVDPIKKKLFDSYKEMTGKDHPESRPKKIETDRYVVEF